MTVEMLKKRFEIAIKSKNKMIKELFEKIDFLKKQNRELRLKLRDLGTNL